MLSAWLTPEAARSLDGNGKFALVDGFPASPDEIGHEYAITLASAYIDFLKHAVGNLIPYLEEGRGGPLHLEAFRICGRSFYAHALVAPLPSTPPLSLLRKAYGSQWLFEICEVDPEPVVSLYIAARTKVQILGGHLVFECYDNLCLGGDFFVSAIRARPPKPDLSPEGAVRRVFQAFGVRIASPPEPWTCSAPEPDPFYPCAGFRWRVRTEVPVRVRREGSELPELHSEFFVALGPPHCILTECVYVADLHQPGPTSRLVSIPNLLGGADIDSIITLTPVAPLILRQVLVGRSR
jgi:hypothetical protein